MASQPAEAPGAVPELGIVEGYFGTPWTWEDRSAVMRLLAGHGYSFFHYAPKADRRLRRAWREAHSSKEMDAMTRFAADCHAHGVRFGIGLSPYGAPEELDTDCRKAIAEKVRQLDETGLDDLAILFDDTVNKHADVAFRHVEIVHAVAEKTRATRLLTCPSYYSDDPVLDRTFGQRPPDYLEMLGQALDPAIAIFWTGEEVCAREFSVGHLSKIADKLRRRPMLWDNYPVNDGPRMARFLHLRAFTGRNAAIGGYISGHAINPALQPLLTCVPALTLQQSYAMGDDYCYSEAFAEAAATVLGPDLAACVQEDILALQDAGLERLGERRERLMGRYNAIDHPAAREIVRWLEGDYMITAETVQTQ